MKTTCTAMILAEMIVEMTDPKIPRWRKEQLEIQARPVAQGYIKRLKEKV